MSKLNKKDTAKVIELLEKEYPEDGCALEFGSLYQLLVSVVLSAQTTDISVNKATPALFAKAPDAFAMAALSPKEIEGYIHSLGFFRMKALHVWELSKELVEKYGGEVPGDFDKLTALPGVGRKTANVVLAEGFGEQRIAVDTHVFRVANRIGLTEEKNVQKTEEGLMKAIPEDERTHMHHALIWHGRRVCDARKPQCESCCLKNICKRNGL